MQYVDTHDQQALQTQLDQERARLDGLLEDLRSVEGELEGLASERQQFQLLDAVCGGLEELDALGASALFWSGPAITGTVEEHIRSVRGRADAFHKRLDEIEVRRQEIVDEIERTQENTDFIEDDLFEIERQAELRKLEWIPEREAESFAIRSSRMPWARGGEEDWLFRKLLVTSLLVNLLLGSALPLIDLPLPEPWEELVVPDRLTRLVTTQLPPPPPPVPQEPIAREPKPTEELASEEAPPGPSSDGAPGPATASKGILAFREKFSGLAENDPGARLGANARIDDSGEAAPGWATRSLVSTRASGSSGGINLASLSRNVGGQGGDGIAGVQVARATSSIGSGGGGGGSGRPLSGGGLGPARTDEEIQIVFDRHKAALYRLYNRELRRDPTLQGQMVLRLRIEPSGSVSLCELQSSDMKAPQLSAQVVDRVKAFDFGAKEGVATVTILYPIDFLPAA